MISGFNTEIDEKQLTDRLSRQHKLICAAVKAGRINELKEMTAKKAATSAKPRAEVAVTAVDTAAPMHPTVNVPIATMETAPPAPTTEPALPRAPLKIAIVEAEEIIDVVPTFEEELILEGIHIIEDEELELLPAEAIAAVSELSGRERPANSKLALELLGDTKFKGGDRCSVNIMLCRGTDRKVVADAQIMIKVLGSTFRPVIFHAKSDANGIARVHLQLPQFQAGRAALLIRAMSDGQEVELRRVVTPG